MIPNSDHEGKQNLIHRIHRIQGQLKGLHTAVEESQDVEQLVTQARAVERAVTSLIVEMIENHLQYQTSESWRDDPEEAASAVIRLFDLSHR